MISSIFEFVSRLILGILFFIILFPVLLVFSTPAILIGAMFVPGGYKSNVLKLYKAILVPCLEWVIFLMG